MPAEFLCANSLFVVFCTFSNPRQKRLQQEMREGLVEDPISGGIVSAMLYQTLFD